jgi:hypothetical protein
MNFETLNTILKNPSWDVVVFFVFLAVGFFYGISAGRSKLLALVFSLYVSGFLFENFYYLGEITNGRTIMEEFLIRGGVFLALVIVLTVTFSKVLVSGYDSGPKNWWKAFLLSFSATGLLFSFLFHLFPGREVFTFSPMIQNIFASNASFFWWLLTPLVALFIARK